MRWWDRWLKDVDNGIMDEPMLRAWMQDSVPPRTSYDERPGRWVAERRWPSPRIETASLPSRPPASARRRAAAVDAAPSTCCARR